MPEMCPWGNGGQGHPGLCWLFPYLVKGGGNDLTPISGMCEVLCPVWGFPVHVTNTMPYEERLGQLGLLILEKFSEGSIFCLQLPSKREEKPKLFLGVGRNRPGGNWHCLKHIKIQKIIDIRHWFLIEHEVGQTQDKVTEWICGISVLGVAQN